MKKYRRILLLAMAVLILLVTVSGCASAPSGKGKDNPTEVYTLIFSFSDPETNAQYTGIFKPWFDKITQATDGRVVIESHFNQELVGLGDAYDAVAKGTVDMAYVRPNMVPAGIFDILLEAAPFGYSSTRNTYVYNKLYSEYSELGEAFSDVKFLLRFKMTPGYLGTVSEPIVTADQFKGKKLITSDALEASRVSALGASPVDVPPPEFYSSLEKGTVDGATVVTMPEMINYSWADVINAVTLVPFIQACSGVIINLDTWNSLPEDIREIIDGMQAEVIEMADTAMNRALEESIEKLRSDEYSTVFAEPDQAFLEAMEDLTQPAIDAYISELAGKGYENAAEIYARYLQLLSENP